MGIIRRWTSREESSLRKQFHGKTMGARLHGLRRAERNEAKLFLVAITPVLITSLFVPKWSNASDPQRLAMVVSGTWSVGILLIGSFVFFRSLIRASRKQDG
jgi:hypothetical protein